MSVQALQAKPGSRRSRVRVGRGRGSGKGKTCGRGTKGQMSRKGHKRKPGFEGGQMPLVRRLPKRGFKNPTRTAYVPVNIARLAVFDDGAEVGIDSLKEAGLANGAGARVKILGQGALDRRLHVRAHAFSASARQAIESAGGTCDVVT